MNNVKNGKVFGRDFNPIRAHDRSSIVILISQDLYHNNRISEKKFLIAVRNIYILIYKLIFFQVV